MQGSPVISGVVAAIAAAAQARGLRGGNSAHQQDRDAVVPGTRRVVLRERFARGGAFDAGKARLADEELRETITEAIAALPERLQLIVQLYFVEELNLSEIAEVLSVSVPRVHQLKAQALDKLKAALGRNG
jgi:RNA polymerase sigma factor (sigma-70 family)